jgi:hypothetical protein
MAFSLASSRRAVVAVMALPPKTGPLTAVLMANRAAGQTRRSRPEGLAQAGDGVRDAQDGLDFDQLVDAAAAAGGVTAGDDGPQVPVLNGQRDQPVSPGLSRSLAAEWRA